MILENQNIESETMHRTFGLKSFSGNEQLEWVGKKNLTGHRGSQPYLC